MRGNASSSFSTSKKPRKSVPAPQDSFVWGSKPSSLRAPYPPRIKPGPANTTQYGKDASFGDTGNTGFS